MDDFNILSWEDYFLSVSFLSAMRSKDPCSQVGACIVSNEKIILSIGYNGMPRGCSDDQLPWNKESLNKLENKYMYVCHAETNAILNKNSADVTNATIYVAMFPCNECSKMIIQSGIKEVVYFSDKHKEKPETIGSKIILNMAGVKVRRILPAKSHVEIIFRSPILKSGSEVDANEKLEDKFETLCRDVNRKRLDYLSWEEYFMSLVFLTCKRSKDPDIKLGACIVNDKNKIVGVGYNGMPRKCDDSKLPWTSSKNILESKDTYMVHAELNAILNKNYPKISGCRMFVAAFPCNECAKCIIQEDITEIVYFSDDRKADEFIAAKKLFDMAGVKYRPYEGKLKKCVINFDAINWNVTSHAQK